MYGKLKIEHQMLVHFSVSNFSSIKDETVLSMIPAKSRNMKDHIITDIEGKKIQVLPVACIYGANASGKTNFIKAIEFAQALITVGTKPNSSIGIISHLLDPIEEVKPSRFEFVFKHDHVLYTYGFVIDKKTVLEEWLFAYYTSQESKIFERITKNDKTKVFPGARLKEGNGEKFLKYVEKGTRLNQLLLTEANEKNIEILKPVFHWFQEHLVVVRPDYRYISLTKRVSEEKDFEVFLADFLRLADTGISNIHVQKEKFDTDTHLRNMPDNLKEKLLSDLLSDDSKEVFIQGSSETFIVRKDKDAQTDRDLTYLRLQTEHLKTDGTHICFDPAVESDGTKRLMDLAPMLFDVWDRERVYVIDELDRSLHTFLSRLFLQMCVSRDHDKKSFGQFILTTHDTNLLDRSLLRKDEIWFMEKDRDGASHLTSLMDYKVSDGLNYENGYLNGRFGAIPLVKNWKEIFH